MNDFLFRQEFKFEIIEKKVTISVPKQMKQFVEMFKDKFKEILGLELVVKEEKAESSKNTKTPQ